MPSQKQPQGDADSGDGKHLADILPIDRATVESLSWQLGSRVTSEGASQLFAAGNQTTGSMLTVFEATDHTCIVEYRTPVGREKYFGVADAELRPMLETLLDSRNWVPRDGRVENV